MKSTALLLAAALLGAAGPATAGWRPELASQPPEVQAWFKQQHNSRGEWCCDESDGHPFYGDYSINANGSVTVELGGAPHVIAPDLVLRGTNPTGHAVWWYRDVSGVHRDYCFAPGPLG